MLDIILLGATGFTGRRAAKYLNENAPADVSWGIAGRNMDKLNMLSDELGVQDERIFQTDSTNPGQVDELVSNCRILITTAGPFSLYGEEVVRACAETGTHYLDITGEVDFIKKMMELYAGAAKASGAVLIPFSGFDSVPADLAAFISAKEYENPEELIIRSYYTISGGFNGGTIATMMNKFETGEYKKMGDPRLLLGDSAQQVAHAGGSNYAGFDKTIQRWSLPFIMGAINSKVVYRSAALMNEREKPYARKITYSEHSALGRKNEPFSFLMLSVLLGSIQKLGPYSWFRKILSFFSPAPGEGPSEETIENGFFKADVFSTNNTDRTAHFRISYPGDPGNKSTVFFLCESALLLQQLIRNNNEAVEPGFQTPVSAFGQKLADHLSEKGLMVEKRA